MSTPRTVIVTGSAGLIGSETVRRFAGEGARVIGIDNNMRAEFFGAEASTKKTRDDLIANVSGYEHHDLDIRDTAAVTELFKRHRSSIAAIVHTASQPSRLGRSRSANRFYRQRQRHAESFGSRQTVFSGGAVYF